MTDYPNQYPGSKLTLSAAPEPGLADSGAPAVDRSDRDRFLGAGGCPHCWPADEIRAERDPAIVTEAELRLLDGN